MTIDRVVVDSNVLISASLVSGSTPARLLDGLQQSRAIMLFSDPTMDELRSRILRTKFDRWVDRGLRERFLAELDAVAELVGIAGAPIGCRDRDDDKFLETALVGEADLIISGDQDLLIMHPWQQIPILSPSQAIDWLEDRHS